MEKFVLYHNLFSLITLLPQTVLEETLYDALNDGSYDGIVESVTKSRKRNKEKSAIG